MRSIDLMKRILNRLIVEPLNPDRESNVFVRKDDRIQKLDVLYRTQRSVEAFKMNAERHFDVERAGKHNHALETVVGEVRKRPDSNGKGRMFRLCSSCSIADQFPRDEGVFRIQGSVSLFAIKIGGIR